MSSTFSDSFGTANGRVRLPFQINRCMVNTICFRFDLIRFLCVWPYWEIFSNWKNNADQLSEMLAPLASCGPINAPPPETPRTLQHYRSGGFKGGGGLNGLRLRREKPVSVPASRTAGVSFSSLRYALWSKYLNIDILNIYF